MSAQAAERVKAQVQKVKDKAQKIVDEIAVCESNFDFTFNGFISLAIFLELCSKQLLTNLTDLILYKE